MNGIIKNTSLALATLAFSAVAAAGDLSGTWELTVDSPEATSKPTMTLSQEGNQVTGTYTGSFGSSDIAGTVDGDKFALTATMSAQGQDFALTYSGSQSGDTISGDLDLGGMGGAAFTGKRQ